MHESSPTNSYFPGGVCVCVLRGWEWDFQQLLDGVWFYEERKKAPWSI